MAKTFLWIEDRKGKASYIFWGNFMKQLYPDVFDNSFDNLQVVMEQKRLKKYANEQKNVCLLDIICFEYILLEFTELIEWIYASEDDFLKKRAGMIEARHKLVETLQDDDFDYKGIREIVDYDKRIEEHNIEQLSAKLLFDLTRNTGFEVSKGTLGERWIKSCCEWGNRQEDDICGLDHNRLAVFDKMKRIYDGSSLKLQFPKVGLEVVA